MDPSQQFEWCMRALKRGFQLISQDIFTATLLFLICSMAATIYTVAHYDAFTAFTAAVTVFGTSQVK